MRSSSVCLSGERVEATDETADAAAAKADGDGDGDWDLDLGLCPTPTLLLLPPPPPMPPVPPPPRCGVLAPLLATEGDADGDDEDVESARPRLGLDLAR